MKTLATFKEAAAILALSTVMTFSLTSCEKDEMATPANSSSFEQASRSDASMPATTELNSDMNRQQTHPTSIDRSPGRPNTSTTGIMPSKIGDSKKARFNEPAIAKTGGANTTKPEHKPVAINSNADKSVPMNNDIAKVQNTLPSKNEPGKN